MYLKKVRKSHKNKRVFRNILHRNPILFYGLALPFVIVAATNLKTALVLSCVLAISTIPTLLLLPTFAKRIPPWVRVICTTTLAMLLITFAIFIISKFDLALLDALGMYLPLLALNTILITQTDAYPNKDSLGKSFVSISVNCLGFAVVACTMGAIRELLGSASLFGYTIAVPVTFPALLIPFSGFILLGFLAAGVKLITRSSNAFFMISEKKELELKQLKRQARKEHLMRGNS